MADIPEGLGLAGAALWADVSAGRALTAANKILLLNACRIADNLDNLSAETPKNRVVSENHLGTECIHPTISEFRQQVTALQNILTKLGVADLPAEGGGGKGFFDQLAAKRRERDAG
ncbi:hypothetical protein [Mycobacteroides immunogenum]|uniref:Terminase n=1 Tax=Mycobacteroides immunogenum TaxID=83262 RepID=A0A7V8RXE1_9MYCO|nr:hypothetical protein [Mycobacteroides immunogenum]KPG13735.1 hypothetical protein AN909_05640 [Mycobacteroides immunogenum]KPG14275.1 hypothetical protein AN908_06760 [Mycobacteroides immunogenum]KPG14351.1 hypothetical protein AN908_07270 [Mycobacteroides immunogenum]KPG17449.1 hypothetical protein AN910_04865 [Mycobacteroides immunogenum]KPG24856.1 hypothetical protein AN911_00290 [Mycobacteroides immunogenum]